MKNYVLLLVLVILFSSCRSITRLFNGRGEKSSATGWKINDRSNGGCSLATSYGSQQTPPGMTFIEGGSFTMGGVQDDVMYDWNSTPTTLHIRSFYMDQTEVTNAMYLEYLYWLKRVFPPDEKEEYRIIYESALPDTLVWRNTLGALDALVEGYSSRSGDVEIYLKRWGCATPSCKMPYTLNCRGVATHGRLWHYRPVGSHRLVVRGESDLYNVRCAYKVLLTGRDIAPNLVCSTLHKVLSCNLCRYAITLSLSLHNRPLVAALLSVGKAVEGGCRVVVGGSNSVEEDLCLKNRCIDIVLL